MQLHGKNIIAGRISSASAKTFSAIAPASGEPLKPLFFEATPEDIHQSLAEAAASFDDYRSRPPEQIAAFLEQISTEIIGLGDNLIQRAHQETALPEARLTGEQTRTVNQLKMFAKLVREGSWVEACIDRALPNRQPTPKPSLRRMVVPIGPVVVFSASNFPLAFSVAGGDTASALAAGNPVVVKAHPAHPGTSELVAQAIRSAAKSSGLPAGVFSMLHGKGHDVGLQLVQHPTVRAVGFTGSLAGGRALFDAAAARPEPIPVFAEMGSTNPVFILPGVLEKNSSPLAQGLFQSATLGVGQFCTKPGLVFGLHGSAWESLEQSMCKLAEGSAPGAMLYSEICERFDHSTTQAKELSGVRVLGQCSVKPSANQATAVVFATDAATFQREELLRVEMFGPATLLVKCGSTDELENIARQLPGQLTATVHGTDEDLSRHKTLIGILEQKAGRLIFNGFPTGVEVCPSMHHGGPYPATTTPHFTSVGTMAIKRFARPVCFQNFPDNALPPELRNQNTRKIWRLVDGQLTRDDV